MKDIVIFGYGYTGILAARFISNCTEYNLIGFADNSVYKQGYYAYGYRIRSMAELISEASRSELSVIVASNTNYNEIIDDCNNNGIRIEGVFLDRKLKKYPWATFESLDLSRDIIFYAGDIEDQVHFENKDLYGLSITKNDDRHIYHDITKKYPIPDNSIASYEAECVMELIGEENVLPALREIYRIIRPGGWLRITVPDYYSPYLKMRSMTDDVGRIVYDAGETYLIKYGKDGIIGGNVWYTNYDVLCEKIREIPFSNVDWLCYHTENGTLYKKEIDMTKGYVHRISNDSGIDVYCLVVDCYK